MNTPTLRAQMVGVPDGVSSATPQELSALPSGSEWPRRVLIVCSSGGHLVQLVRLRQWWQTRDRMWVTFPGPDAESQLVGEDVKIAYHPTTRNAVNAVRNLGLALKIVRSYRPDVVVSSGAGVALPFFLAARLRGIRTVYLEVFDRIDGPTLTGRLCYPITDLFLLQWEEQKRSYPRGQVVGSVL
jgi:UDP-N-acetylglucosamine:LPS N-acetylglucosamine transferase